MKYYIKTNDGKQVIITDIRLLTLTESQNLLRSYDRAFTNNWWLYDAGCSDGYVMHVTYEGNINRYGTNIKIDEYSVRPVVQLANIEPVMYRCGDMFEIGTYKFKLITNNLAWLYSQDIGRTYFDKDYTDYNKSYIKEYINDWLKSEIIDKYGITDADTYNSIIEKCDNPEIEEICNTLRILEAQMIINSNGNLGKVTPYISVVNDLVNKIIKQYNEWYRC